MSLPGRLFWQVAFCSLLKIILFGEEAKIHEREISFQSCLKMGEDLKNPKGLRGPVLETQLTREVWNKQREGVGENNEPRTEAALPIFLLCLWAELRLPEWDASWGKRGAGA